MFRVAGVYAVVGWLLIQVGVAVLPTFEAPGWVLKVFIALILAGFPIALILAWAFELTPDGIKPTVSVSEGESITGQTGRKLDYVIVAGLALVALMIVGDRLLPKAGTQAQAAISPEALLTPLWPSCPSSISPRPVTRNFSPTASPRRSSTCWSASRS